ncbi:hypothetical protein EVAR_31655_1 [Eumeta japonica]|uniref:Uncharacterized protein n=1 Tax=Eumeta variegata TaxID=151549 RepID=A0A4C1VZF5_EUMVA|nr:hypothetical protein EVAR_31655_1 [Eumeta japonica]
MSNDSLAHEIMRTALTKRNLIHVPHLRQAEGTNEHYISHGNKVRNQLCNPVPEAQSKLFDTTQVENALVKSSVLGIHLDTFRHESDTLND